MTAFDDRLAIINSIVCPDCRGFAWARIFDPKKDASGQWHHPSCRRVTGILPHEAPLDLTLPVPTAQSRPPRNLEAHGMVDGVSVPYKLDEAEYRRRISLRDNNRLEAKAKLDRIKSASASRSFVK
jgi:hypothetical protein